MALLDKESKRKLNQAYGKVWDYSDGCLAPEECGSYCCREHFNTYYIEFANVFDHLVKKVGEERAKEILQRETGSISSPLKTIPVTRNMEFRWGKKDNYCKLLENGRCLVYPARPFHCRTYGHNKIQQGFLICGHEGEWTKEENEKVERRIKRLNDALDIPEEWKKTFGFGGESLGYWFGKVFGKSSEPKA